MMSRPISSTLASGLPSLRGALEPAEACTTAFGRSTLGRLAISGRKVGVGVGVSVMAAPVGLEGGGLEGGVLAVGRTGLPTARRRSEEHTSELRSLMRISYAVFCLKQQNIRTFN